MILFGGAVSSCLYCAFQLTKNHTWKNFAGESGDRFAKKIIGENSASKPIQFLKLDLTKDFQSAPPADVIVVNDVLEHLMSDEVSFTVLKTLWDKTEKLLVIHVPFEEKPNPSWGHHVAFNEKKLRDWAGKLPGSRFYSEFSLNGNSLNIASLGFLVVSKEEELCSC